MILLYIAGKRIISVLLSLIMLLLLLPMTTSAVDISVSFDVTERNGVSVEDYLIKRGIPFKKGEVLKTDTFALLCGDAKEEIPVQTKATELYDDGSVKWLLASFLTDLSPNETKSYVLLKKQTAQTTSVSAEITDDGAVLQNSLLTLSVNGFGISSLKYQGVEVLKSGGISLLSLTESERLINNGSVEIAEQGNVYATVKISGEFAETGMRTEQLYTVLADSGKIISEVRFMAMGDTTLNGLAQIVNLKDGFTEGKHQQTLYSSGGENPMYSCGTMSIYNQDSNISFHMVSREPERFRGAVSATVSNGFGFETDKGRMLFAPVHYNTAYTWLDGVNRTAYSEIILCAGNQKSFENNLLTLENTPSVSFSENPFVRAGIIDNDYIAPVVEAQIESIKWLKDKRNGRMDAGSIPYGVDPDHNKTVSWNVRPGEVEYNLWYAQMISSDPVLFDIVNESTQSWADINIYKGKNEWLCGATRYRNNFDHANFETSQPYYGDNSGLYMGYLLTGNEYYKENVKLTADFYLKAANAYPSSGYVVPRTVGFSNGEIKPFNTVEIRYAMTSRSLYQSYRLIGDEKYLECAQNVIKWADAWQHADGYWHQAWQDDTGPHDFYLVKNYIMLYGLRGVCEFYRQTEDKLAKEILVDFADYLITEMQPGGGWLWDPIADVELCEVNEGNERGNSPFQEGMATEIFETVYNATGESKYLEAMLTMAQYYLGSMQKGGFVSVRFCAPDYLDGFINAVVCGQASTMVRMAPRMKKTIEENKDLVRKLGFADMIDYYCDGAENITDKIENPYDDYEVTIHAFQKDDRRSVYVVNHSGANSGEWEKDICINTGGGGYIYKDVENEVLSGFATNIKTHLGMFEIAAARSIPVKVVSQISTVKAKIVAYDEKQILLDLASDAGEVKLKITDGEFGISAGDRFNYIISDSPESGYKRLKITKEKACGMAVADANGELALSIDFGGEIALYSDVESHWSKNEVASLLYGNVLSSNDENLFYPDETITAEEYITLVMKVAGVLENQIEFAKEADIIGVQEDLSACLTREQMADIALRVTEWSGEKIDLGSYGVTVQTALVPAEIVSDEEAVRADAEKLSIENTDRIMANIPLASGGIHGSNVSWASNKPEIVSADGVVKRPPAGSENAEVKLTATISRGSCSMTKEFNLTVLNNSFVNYSSAINFSKATYATEKSEADEKIRFTAHVTKDTVDFVIGHIDVANGLKANQDMPVIVRFNPSGYIDAYNLSGYQALEEVKYLKDTDYTFEIDVNFKKRTYSVSVCGQDGVWHKIAVDFQFRQTAKDLNGFNSVVLSSGAEDGLGIISVHSKAMAQGSPEPINLDYTAGYMLKNVKLTDKNAKGEGLLWYSLNTEVIDNSGAFVSRPDFDCEVKLIGVPAKHKIFGDIAKISNKYAENVIKCGLIGLVSMNGAEFMPKEPATRAQAAAVAQRVRSYFKK